MPPKSPKTLVGQVFKALLTLETHPVFIGGDFNRCDQHHPQLWEDFLGQLGVTDIDPTFPTFRFGEQQESPLDRFLVPSFFLDTTQLHVRISGRYRVSTCHHKTVTACLSMKPRLTPHPQSEKHCTIPTKVFLDPTAFAVGEVEAKRQQALRLLRRSISLARESCAAAVPFSTHIRALVWSWWRNSSKAFKHISPLTKLYKRLGKGQLVLHIHKETLQCLYEQSGLIELLQSWPKQYDQSLVPADVIATALQTAEIAATTLTQMCSSWVLQLAKYLLFGRRIRHKVQGRLLPPRKVFSGVDMGRSTSIFFFCLAMDPIFVALNQVPRVLLVAGYVDDTTIVGTQQDPEWIKEVFSLINTWSAAGVIMDAHTCWQVGLSRVPLPEQQLLRLSDYADAFIPWHPQGEATISTAVRRIPHYAHYFVLRHGEHCVMFHAAHRHDWVLNGHPLLLQLAASPCDCRSKTQLLTSAAFSAAQLYHVDRAGLGAQCIVPSTVNLGLTIHTGWACQLQLHAEQMEYAPLRLTMPSLLVKQPLKFRTRLLAGNKGNLSIHAKIVYFNAFSLSLFYYVQTHRYFSRPLLQP